MAEIIAFDDGQNMPTGYSWKDKLQAVNSLGSDIVLRIGLALYLAGRNTFSTGIDVPINAGSYSFARVIFEIACLVNDVKKYNDVTVTYNGVTVRFSTSDASAIASELKRVDVWQSFVLFLQNRDNINTAVNNLKSNINQSLRTECSQIKEKLDGEDHTAIINNILSAVESVTQKLQKCVDNFSLLSNSFITNRDGLETISSSLSERLVDLSASIEALGKLGDLPNSLTELNSVVSKFEDDQEKFFKDLPSYFATLNKCILDVNSYITNSIRGWFEEASAVANSEIRLSTKVDELWENLKQAESSMQELNEASVALTTVSEQLGQIYSLYDNIVAKVPSLEKLQEIITEIVKNEDQSTKLEALQTLFQGVNTGLLVKQEFGKKGAF